MRKTSRHEPLRRYGWGSDCTGWELSEEDGLSVKEESMPPGAAEKLHVHQQATQVFYILGGEATFEIGTERFKAMAGESITIRPGERHRILNESPEELTFILSSAPTTRNDRTDIDEHE